MKVTITKTKKNGCWYDNFCGSMFDVKISDTQPNCYHTSSGSVILKTDCEVIQDPVEQDAECGDIIAECAKLQAENAELRKQLSIVYQHLAITDDIKNKAKEVDGRLTGLRDMAEQLRKQLAEAQADYLRVKESNDELCFEIRKAKAYISGLESEKCVCEEITDLRRIICDMLRKQL